MSFNDNSGDIIIDAVLTDEGRRRLANGNFKITKFAFFDDEIDYSLYDAAHASGSAYYDLEIMQTPILEAFTNNTSYGHSTLISIPRNDLWYLPVMRINQLIADSKMNTTLGAYLVAVNAATQTSFATINGVIQGERPKDGTYVRIDQGIDCAFALPPNIPLPNILEEQQYIIEIDNRLGSIVKMNGAPAQVSYIDDDQIASYFLTLEAGLGGTLGAIPMGRITAGGHVPTASATVKKNTQTETMDATEIIQGPRGTTLQFRIQASLTLNTSTSLFNQLGSTFNIGALTNVHYIDSFVRVKGGQTGYELMIPVRFVRV